MRITDSQALQQAVNMKFRQAIDDMKMKITGIPVPAPMAWESTSPIYIAQVTDHQYQCFRPGVQKWYRRIPDSKHQPAITEDQAYAMGAKGAPATEAERLLFEAWMRGHCWKVTGDWNGETYVTEAELDVGFVDYHAMATRQIWAAFRDRGALAAGVTPA